MAKSATTTEVPVVGPRQPCPCGSGKRYKACHGKRRRADVREFVARPFLGLPGECDWIALRELVSSATAPVQLAAPNQDRKVLVATLLPLAVPVLVRTDGVILLALQTSDATGDPSADAARALQAALETAPGSVVTPPPPGPGENRLQDLLDRTGTFPVTVHERFDFWLDRTDFLGPDVRDAAEQANTAISPTARLASVEAGYWCRLGDREQLRWVMPHDEEPLLDALARLHAAGADRLGEGSRLLGTFRALGRLVPVWDLPPGTPVEAVEEPAAALAARLTEALDQTRPLTADERRARSGLANRQVTIR